MEEEPSCCSAKNIIPCTFNNYKDMCNCGICCRSPRNFERSEDCPPCLAVPIVLPISLLYDIVTFIPRMICK